MSLNNGMIKQAIEKIINDFNEHAKQTGKNMEIVEENGEYLFKVKDILTPLLAGLIKVGIKPEVTVTNEYFGIRINFDDIINSIMNDNTGMDLRSIIDNYIIEKTYDEKGNEKYNMVIKLRL